MFTWILYKQLNLRIVIHIMSMHYYIAYKKVLYNSPKFAMFYALLSTIPSMEEEMANQLLGLQHRMYEYKTIN